MRCKCLSDAGEGLVEGCGGGGGTGGCLSDCGCRGEGGEENSEAH